MNFHLFQFGNYIYWTDWQTQRIERADKDFGTNVKVIKQFFEGLMDIEVVSPYKQTGKLLLHLSFSVISGWISE